MIAVAEIVPGVSLPVSEAQDPKISTGDFRQLLSEVQDTPPLAVAHTAEALQALDSVLQALAEILQPLTFSAPQGLPVPSSTEASGQNLLGSDGTLLNVPPALAPLLGLTASRGEALLPLKTPFPPEASDAAGNVGLALRQQVLQRTEQLAQSGDGAGSELTGTASRTPPEDAEEEVVVAGAPPWAALLSLYSAFQGGPPPAASPTAPGSTSADGTARTGVIAQARVPQALLQTTPDVAALLDLTAADTLLAVEESPVFAQLLQPQEVSSQPATAPVGVKLRVGAPAGVPPAALVLEATPGVAQPAVDQTSQFVGQVPGGRPQPQREVPATGPAVPEPVVSGALATLASSEVHTTLQPEPGTSGSSSAPAPDTEPAGEATPVHVALTTPGESPQAATAVVSPAAREIPSRTLASIALPEQAQELTSVFDPSLSQTSGFTGGPAAGAASEAVPPFPGVPSLPDSAARPGVVDQELRAASPRRPEVRLDESQTATSQPQSPVEPEAELPLPTPSGVPEPRLFSGLSTAATATTLSQQDTAAATRSPGLDGINIPQPWRLPSASQTILLHIEPPEFGPLLVHVRVHEKRLMASIQAESPEVEAILRANLPALQAALSQHGFEVPPISLSLATDGLSTALGHSASGFSQQQSTFHAFAQWQGTDTDQQQSEPEPGRLFSELRPYKRRLVDVVI